MTTLRRFLLLGLASGFAMILVALSASAKIPKQDLPPDINKESLAQWGQSQAVFLANLIQAQGGPVGLSEPPVFTHRLQLVVKGQALRGPIKNGDMILGMHSIRQQNVPVFPVGKECVVAATLVRGNWRVDTITEATPAAVAKAKSVCSIPLGWKVENKELISPWFVLGNKAWPENNRPKGIMFCAKTGRPAYLAGDNVEMTLEVVPPKVSLKYGNPDGDGEFKIIVTNPTKKDLTVSALLSDGKKILWDESLVILCQGKVYPIPGAKGISGKVEPTVLKPGQSVSTVVNVLKLKGPDWPRGGYRIEFQFCLGEQSVSKSFYYLSKHLDPIREKLK